MTELTRRYDIDWLRVIAIGLLVIYHTAIGFQPWGMMIAFITSIKSWEALWTPMMMLNVWRIPLLFFVSGMGVHFAMQRRGIVDLFLERTRRILIPYLFGLFAIVPVHIFLWQKYYGYHAAYHADPGHLWFLGNIMCYVALLSPLFYYLKCNPEGRLARSIRAWIGGPFGLISVVAVFVAEAVIIDPKPYELYARTWHGVFLGLFAFFFGFCFVFSGDGFWNRLMKMRWLFLLAAAALFTVRINRPGLPVYWLVVESDFWIFAILGLAYRYLNFNNSALRYLSAAAYPVYIMHMIFLYLGSMLIFPLPIANPLQYLLLVLFTIGGSMASYEWIIRRFMMTRFLFGLKEPAGSRRWDPFSSMKRSVESSVR